MQLTLDKVAADLQDRLISIFTRGPDGRRPCFGGTERLQQDPAWHDNLIFSEYFHGDNGAAIGAFHQTGWTGLIADVIRRRHGAVDPVGDVIRRIDREDRAMTAVSQGRPLTALPGSPFPLGATPGEGGTNFAVASGVADGMALCLFDEAGAETQIPLRDYDAGVWHALRAGDRAKARPTGTGPPGPTIRLAGVRCNPAKLLLDPYARAISGDRSRSGRRCSDTPPATRMRRAPRTPPASMPRSLVVADDAFRWRDGSPSAAPVLRHDHLRTARQGFHHAPSRDAAGAARNVRRAGP